jgi:heme oxygenase
MRLRDDLRRHTRVLHQRVEEQLGCLDLRTRAGLDRFLLTHHAAVLPIERRLAESSQRGPATGFEDGWPFSLTDLLCRDLDARGLRPTAGVPADRLQDAHPLGLCYVLGGSRLGARLLLKRLAGADGAPETAPAYLTRAPDGAIWSRTLTLLGSAAAEAAPRDAVLAAADIAFACFADALTLVGHPRENIDALAV